jgi:hypothetical protein
VSTYIADLAKNSMSTSPAPDFSNDRPLTSSEDDRLNRAAFAKRIAGVLIGLPKGAGLVVGIHGPWGDGKTTVLNMLRADLEASTNTATVDFNPWRFTDETSMLTGFFRMLAGIIRAKLKTKGEAIALLVENVGRYASVVNERFDKIANLAAPKGEPSLEELRDRLSNALMAAEKRIVVLIDDIDRLDKHETHTLFRLIKACADFPNVCYVLAFDDTAVAQALGERYGSGDEPSGRAFLEKIIQIPLKLPAAAKEDLRSLCLEQVDKAIMAAGIELTRDQVGEFISGFDRGASVRLTTPRAAKRYGNGLMFALPMLKGEVNLIDLLLVEALRAFFPEVYDIVRNNHEDFSGVESDRHRRASNEPRYAELLKAVLDSMPTDHADAVKDLLVDLFPRLSNSYEHGFNRGGYGSDWLPRWSREQRISSPDYCPRYFTYAVPLNDVPDAEIVALLDMATMQEEGAVEAWLTMHLVGLKASRVIEKLRAIEKTVGVTAAETLALVIAKSGKNLPNPLVLFREAEPPTQAGILISNLLSRISDRSKRVAVAERVVATAEPLWFGVECIRWMHVTDKPEKQDLNTLTKEEIVGVRRILVECIKARAAAGFPLFDPDVRQESSLLFEWWRAEGRDPVQAHLVRVFTKAPKQVTTFLHSQAPHAWGIGNALPHVSEIDAYQLNSIKLVIDLGVLAELIKRHCPGDFDNPQWFPNDTGPLEQRLAEQFMFVYNQWKSEGEPPDSSIINSDEASSTELDGNQSDGSED